MRIVGFFILSTVLFASIAYAQPKSRYAGQEKREIKALSASEIEGYLQGYGMGFAKAAELNHHPGPKHVLDLSEKLKLTEEQRKQTQAIYSSMKKKAMLLGKQLIEKERELDQLFAKGAIDEDRLKSIVFDIGKIQAEIRYVHLNAHLEQRKVLTEHQIRLYDQLRGYYNNENHMHPGEHHSH